MNHSGAIDLGSFPQGIQPIVRVIGDWFANRPLALIVEGKVGKGKILISGIDLVNDLENRPEAQQLLFSLKKYMADSQFNPAIEFNPGTVRSLTKN